MAQPEDVSRWVGRTEVREEIVVLAPARLLLATLDDVDTRLDDGDELPALWHWLYFLPDAAARGLGTDGHPRTGDFLPPIALPRRMFAGAQLQFSAPLLLGRTARRVSEVISIQSKQGRQGALVFLTVRHCIHQEGRLCVTETQTLLYRGEGRTDAVASGTATAEVPGSAWVREVVADPVLLFRWSALTFNAHRIHYDLPYAVEREGYPGLVVQGPLVAMLLMDLIRRNDPRPVTTFSFRANAPLYAGSRIQLVGSPVADRVTLHAEGPHGVRAVLGEAVLGA